MSLQVRPARFQFPGASIKQNAQEVNVSLVIIPVVVVTNLVTVSNSSKKCFKEAHNGGDVAMRPADSFQELGSTQFDAVCFANAMLSATLWKGS
jgi:hypothetical protein